MSSSILAAFVASAGRLESVTVALASYAAAAAAGQAFPNVTLPLFEDVTAPLLAQSSVQRLGFVVLVAQGQLRSWLAYVATQPALPGQPAGLTQLGSTGAVVLQPGGGLAGAGGVGPSPAAAVEWQTAPAAVNAGTRLFNVDSDPVRAAAVAECLATGAPSLSSYVSLALGPLGDPASLLFAPVPPAAPGGATAALVVSGFTWASVRGEEGERERARFTREHSLRFC